MTNRKVLIRGNAEYPAEKSDWVDNQDSERRLHVTEVVPGDHLGREIRGLVKRVNLERDYATNLETFHKVWVQAS
jgi:hypothetical protein